MVALAGGGSPIPENGREVTETPLKKESQVAKVATAWVEVGLKSSAVERGVDLGGWLHRREVVDAKKSIESGVSNKKFANKMTAHLANVCRTGDGGGSQSLASREVVVTLVLVL